jgi:transcriptional regulator with XRE-family HTH domain
MLISFTANLKRHRKSLGLTQEEFADKIFKSRSAYSMYELGEYEPDLQTLLRIANVFNTSVDDLLTKTEVEESTSANQRTITKTRNQNEQRYQTSSR